MPNILKGIVTKTGVMRKTITVTISRTFEHPKLLKKMHRTKKMLVHDEEEKARIGDVVTILHGRTISARKTFALSSIDHRPGHGHQPDSAVLAALGDRNVELSEEIHEAKEERRA